MGLLANSNAIESGGYNIDRSLRFRSSASAYLSRTFGTTNRRTYTFSLWCKLGALSTARYIYNAEIDGNNQFVLSIDSNNVLNLFEYKTAYNFRFTTTQVLRDPSAWYHIVVAIDTTQATNTNRVKLYLNGSQITAFSTATYPTQNYDTLINYASTTYYNVGRGTAEGRYFDGYLAEVNFIDGQALTPSSFGYTEPLTGVWQPLKYMGTYGTNGFYLPFTDNTSATTLAYDKSGNGNNWTPNNISTTAGATYDSMTDVPTLTSATAANFAVWNPLDRTAATYSEGNLKVVSSSAAAPYNMTATIQTPLSGKFYWEVQALQGASNPGIGIGNNRPSDQFALYRTSGAYINGNISGISSSGTPTTFTTNDIIGCAYDIDAGTLVFYKNGVAQTGGFSGIPATGYFPCVRADSASGDGGYLNCGQRPFSYTPPTGFKALNTFNLPDPTIKKPNQYMDVITYTGDGTSSRTITSSLGFTPDLAWGKSRSAVLSHALVDSVRGNYQTLSSNLTNAESAINSYNLSTANSLITWNANETNQNGATYATWLWKKGATPGFDIVTYTGNGANRTISHSLGVAPSMMIVKSRSQGTTGYTGNWAVWHSAIANTEYLLLNTTAAKATGATYWNSTTPTSSVFSLGTAAVVNNNNDNFVNYLFAEIAGFSKFGSYTGNGSADGPFVFTNFQPKFVMIKRTDSTGEWDMFDTSRSPYNLANVFLQAQSSAAEATGSSVVEDILSNGFKIRGTDSSLNASGGTYIYACFASNPFKTSLAR